MNLTWGCECSRPVRRSAKAIAGRMRVTRVQPGALTTGTKINRRELIRDQVRLRRHLMVEGQRALIAFLTGYFRDTITAVCDRVTVLSLTRKYSCIVDTKIILDRKADIDLGDVGNEIIWREAITEVLGIGASVDLVVGAVTIPSGAGTAAAELVANYMPIVQSVAARAAERTSILLGEPQAANVSVDILHRSQELARQVTRINETTRTRLIDTIQRTLDEGQTIAESVRTIRQSIPEISAGRIPTIARTEIGRAVDEGTKVALKASKSVTFVSVIGCTAREVNSPQWRGQSTCNIQNVPTEFVDELTWHPNHTGCLCASAFVSDR